MAFIHVTERSSDSDSRMFTLRLVHKLIGAEEPVLQVRLPIQDIAHRDLKPENILVESRQLITTHVLPTVTGDYFFCSNLGFLSICFKL